MVMVICEVVAVLLSGLMVGGVTEEECEERPSRSGVMWRWSWYISRFDRRARAVRTLSKASGLVMNIGCNGAAKDLKKRRVLSCSQGSLEKAAAHEREGGQGQEVFCGAM